MLPSLGKKREAWARIQNAKWLKKKVHFRNTSMLSVSKNCWNMKSFCQWLKKRFLITQIERMEGFCNPFVPWFVWKVTLGKRKLCSISIMLPEVRGTLCTRGTINCKWMFQFERVLPLVHRVRERDKMLSTLVSLVAWVILSNVTKHVLGSGVLHT